MKKKKLKKKYKQLQKQYDVLWCEYVRIKTDDERIKAMTDEQILHYRQVLVNFANNISEALKNMNH